MLLLSVSLTRALNLSSDGLLGQSGQSLSQPCHAPAASYWRKLRRNLHCTRLHHISILGSTDSQPYIMKAYFGLENPPVKLAKVAIGDGTLTSGQVFELLPAVRFFPRSDTSADAVNHSLVSSRRTLSSSVMIQKCINISKSSELKRTAFDGPNTPTGAICVDTTLL